jgi:hypothetical protein
MQINLSCRSILKDNHVSNNFELSPQCFIARLTPGAKGIEYVKPLNWQQHTATMATNNIY